MAISKKERLKIKLIDLASQSTSHGIPNIARSEKTYIKLIWTILFIASSSVGIYACFQTLFDYLDYEVLTKMDVIDATPSEFPAITFFNLRDQSSNYSPEEIIMLCLFKTTLCDINDFEKIRDKNNFTSYRYITKKQSFLPGQFYGLQVYILMSNTTYIGSYQDGLKIIIHNNTIDPGYYNGYSNDGINVPKGFITNIAINRVFSSKLDEPYNNCLKDITSINSFDSEIYRFILKSTNYSYTQKDCFDYCIGREFARYLNISNKIDNWLNIYSLQTDKLKFELINLLYNLTDGNLINICSKECPLECDAIKYEASISFSKLVLEGLLAYSTEVLKYNLTPKFKELLNFSSDYVKNNLIGVNIYYDSLKYTYISQVPQMEIIDLISNIGGILGLFIGISFLSFAEILELFIEIILICFQDSKNTKIENNTNT